MTITRRNAALPLRHGGNLEGAGLLDREMDIQRAHPGNACRLSNATTVAFRNAN